MVLRTARKDPRAGQPFWGCSAYPDCTGARPPGPPYPAAPRREKMEHEEERHDEHGKTFGSRGRSQGPSPVGA